MKRMSQPPATTELTCSALPASKSQSLLLPYLALVIGTLGLGFSAIFVKWANVPGAVSGFYRMGLAALIMAAPFARDVRRRRQNGPLSRRHVWLAVLSGLFFAGDLGTWNTAVLMTSASNATFLGNTAPIWVGLGTLFIFKQRLGRAFWVGLALGVAGSAWMVGQDFLANPTFGVGSVLSLIAAFFYGGYFLLIQRARERLSSLTTWWISAAVTTVALAGVSVAFGQSFTGYPVQSYLSLLGLALVTQVAAYLAVNYALGHLPAAIVAPTLLGQPILTALLAVPLLGQPITWTQIAGGALVIAGIWIVNRYADAEKDERPEAAPKSNTVPEIVGQSASRQIGSPPTADGQALQEFLKGE